MNGKMKSGLPFSELPTGTVTFLFTDIEGSTRLWQEHPEAMPKALARHHALLQDTIAAHRGYVFQITGDAFCAAFATARDGLRGALAAQRALRDEAWGETGPIRVRIAIHTGPAEVRAGDYTSGEYVSGLTLSQAARLLSAGHGGQVLLSLAAAELVKDYLPEDVTLRDMGAPRLKDLVRAGTIYQVVVPDLPSEFPPLKTLDVAPNNLPLQLTSFVGREQEMAQIQELLSQTRLLTLTGAGGSGKTRLALQVAAKMLERYPEGVWQVDLAPLSDSELVMQTIAAVLCIREQAGRSAVTAVTDFVCDKCMLLLLDNCEHLIEACVQAADTLLHACPNLRILATSREAMGIVGEHIYYVPSLALPSLEPLPPIEQFAESEAVRLLLDRAIAIQPRFELNEGNIAAVAQICHRLDGIPLAIELAAARVKLLSPEQIAARLDDRFKLLTAGSRTALPHHQTLEALIDWSHDLLSEAERALFRRLSVFSGGWRMEAAEVVVSVVKDMEPVIQVGEVLDLLAGLVNKSLVVVEEKGAETRYRMLRTIRAYSLSHLQKTEEEGSIRREHLAYYLRLVEAAESALTGGERAQWIRRLEAEQDNLRGALSWALREGSTIEVAEVGAQMAGMLFMYWYLHGTLNEARRWLTLALERYHRSSKARAKALTGSGILAWQQGDYAEAQNYFEGSIQLWRELGDEDGLTEALHFSGHLEFDQRDYNTARSLFAESLAFYKKVGDSQNTPILISDLGLVAYHLGDYESARAYFEGALKYWREAENKDGVADVLNRLGDLARVEDDYDLARTQYEESLKLFKKMKGNLGIASGFHKLGQVARYQGDVERAGELLVKSLILQQEAGNKQGIVECLSGLAGVALADEEPARAAVLFGAAGVILDAIGAPLAPADRMVWDRDTDLLHAVLRPEGLSAAWDEGCAMTQAQAIAYALRDRK